MLKPAAPGTGVISGGAMRAVLEVAGVKDILTKSTGTNNPINTVRATLAALESMRTAQQIAELRGKTVEEIVGRRLAQAYRHAEQTGHVEAGPQAESDAAAVGTVTPVEARSEARARPTRRPEAPAVPAEPKPEPAAEAAPEPKPQARAEAEPEPKAEAEPKAERTETLTPESPAAAVEEPPAEQPEAKA
jgi:hypothetical protein